MAAALSLSLGVCSGKTEPPAETPHTEPAADYVLKNGKIYTENVDARWAEALAVRDGTFVYVGGDTEELAGLIGAKTRVVDLGGRMVTPSLIDAHTHPATVGMTDWHIRMYGLYTLEEILGYISGYLASHSAGEASVCYFEYYPSDMFGPEGPRKEILDEIAPDRPILVQDFSDHASWVNSCFLKLLGANDLAADDPALRHFVRDEKGKLTGWIKEGAWKQLSGNLYDAVGWYPPEACTEEVMGILTGDLKSWGVTAVMDAFVEEELQVKSISDMDKAGKLNMYYDFSVMMSDYASLDDPENHGFMVMSLEETKDTIRRCNEAGIDVHFHMVGDLAFRTVCDAVEELTKEEGALDIRVELCHCELVNEADMGRPAQLGIIVNWTPHWSGGYFGDAALQYLGQERYDSMYQFNPMIESGAIVTFRSDVYSMYEENRANPYFGMQTAMTRVDIEYPLEEGMRTKEDAKLSLEDLLKGYTINPAVQLRIDDVTGSVEAGKKANFNVYSQNLFEVDPMEFRYVLPAAVVFEGEVISGQLVS